MEAAREAYDAFLSHYPYCYGYWRKYADYEKRKGNKKKCEEVSASYFNDSTWIEYSALLHSRNSFAIPTARHDIAKSFLFYTY